MMTPLPMAPLVIALLLLATCVVIHAIVLALTFRWLRRLRPPASLPFLHAVWILVRVAWWVALAHLLEMALWAVAFVKLGALPDFETAAYFSMVTYTTVGYGDVVLPAGWHLLAGIEGLTGILMAGWSTAALFAVITRMLDMGEQGRAGHQPAAP